MTHVFSFFTEPSEKVYFPGAPMLLAAILTLASAYLARRSLKRTAGN